MKKIISVFLTLVILFSVCIAAVRGVAEQSEKYPVVVLPGYSSSTLVTTDENGSDRQVWMLDLGGVGGDILEYIVPIARGIGDLTFRNADRISEIIGNEIIGLTKDIVCNPDGTSKLDIRPLLQTAEESCWANLRASGQGKFCYFDYYLDPRKGGYGVEDSDIFSFMCDFRMGAVDCAARLDTFIEDVLDYTGAEKVNIICESHGGQVAGTYLSMFGSKQQVHNAVLCVPALCGASLAYDLLTQEANLDELELLYFVEYANLIEEDIHWLFEAENLEFVDWIIQGILPYIFRVVGYWGSIWDFCPPSVYDEMKAKWLDSDESAALIEKSDYMHYEIMANYAENLTKCQEEYGVNITMICGTDAGCASGWRANSDGIITTECSSGATCAPWGETFGNSYVQVNDCGGNYKVSPAMTVDASTAFLPDDTFFIARMFHGSEFADDYVCSLAEQALFTDNIENVYSSPAYPQFRYSVNPSHALTAEFDSSRPGYISADDSFLRITNNSEKGRDLIIIGIKAEGADIKFDLRNTGAVAAGESVDIPFKGNLPQERKLVKITVTYASVGSVTPLGERKLGFTLLNGEPGADGEEGSAFTSFINRIVSALERVLKKLGIYNFVVMAADVIDGVFGRLIYGF